MESSSSLDTCLAASILSQAYTHGSCVSFAGEKTSGVALSWAAANTDEGLSWYGKNRVPVPTSVGYQAQMQTFAAKMAFFTHRTLQYALRLLA